MMMWQEKIVQFELNLIEKISHTFSFFIGKYFLFLFNQNPKYIRCMMPGFGGRLLKCNRQVEQWKSSPACKKFIN